MVWEKPHSRIGVIPYSKFGMTLDPTEENLSHLDHFENSFKEWHWNPYAHYYALEEKFYLKNHSTQKISFIRIYFLQTTFLSENFSDYIVRCTVIEWKCTLKLSLLMCWAINFWLKPKQDLHWQTSSNLNFLCICCTERGYKRAILKYKHKNGVTLVYLHTTFVKSINILIHGKSKWN